MINDFSLQDNNDMNFTTRNKMNKNKINGTPSKD